MQKQLGVLFCIVLVPISVIFAADSTLKINIKKSLATSFISKKNEGYLQKSLNAEEFADLLKLTGMKSHQPIKSRGEAHLTVVTPPEFNGDLKNFVSLEEIESIAIKNNIQESDYTPVCLAKSEISQGSETYETYYLIIECAVVVKIREEIETLYRQRGGQRFSAKRYYPHITIGFTHRDLHESDGIMKDKKNCLPIKVIGDVSIKKEF